MFPSRSSCTYATNGAFKCRDTFADSTSMSLLTDDDAVQTGGQTGVTATNNNTTVTGPNNNTNNGTNQPGPSSMTIALTTNGKAVGPPMVLSLPHTATKGSASNICNVLRNKKGWGTMQMSARCEPRPCNCPGSNSSCPVCASASEKKLIWTRDWSANKVETGGYQGQNKGGVDPNGKLYVCRAPMNVFGFDGVHVGKAFVNGNTGKPVCNIPYGGKEYSVTDGAEFLAYQ